MNKNTKKSITCLFLASSMMLSLNSCKKEIDNSLTKSDFNSSISVRNGMLNFTSQKSFDSTIVVLNKLKISDVDKWISAFNYTSLVADTLKEDFSQTIKDPVFRRLLNKDASLTIGDKIFVIKDEKEYLINNLDLEVYKRVLNNANASISKIEGVSNSIENNLKVQKIEVRSTENKIQKLSSLTPLKDIVVSTTYSTAPWGGSLKFWSNEYDNGRPERVEMEIWSQSYAVSASIGVKMTGQAYRSGGVFGSKDWRIDEIYTGKIYGSVNIGDGTGVKSFNTGDSSGQEINYTFKSWGTGDGTVPASPKIYFLDVIFNYKKAPQNPLGGYHHIIQ